MGQYFKPINLDKRELLHPHKFGDGIKLGEFGASGCGTMHGLALLLSDGDEDGGHRKPTPIIGSWAGDRIVIAGDYAEAGRFVPADVPLEVIQEVVGEAFTEEYAKPENITLYHLATRTFKDVSHLVIEAMLHDRSVGGIIYHNLLRSKYLWEQGDEAKQQYKELLAKAVELRVKPDDGERGEILRPDMVVVSR